MRYANMINKQYCNFVKQSKAKQSKAKQSLILNFFKNYVYTIIIKYYSICSLKNYSNSFLLIISTAENRKTVLLILKNLIVKIFLQYLESILIIYIINFYLKKLFVYLF